MKYRQPVLSVIAGSLMSVLAGCGPTVELPSEDAGTGTDGTSTGGASTDDPGGSSLATDASSSAAPTASSTTSASDDSGSLSESSSDSTAGELPSDVPPRMIPDGCEAIAEESAYCLAPNGSEWSVFGVDSGAMCSAGLGAPNVGSAIDLAFAWQGMSIVHCVGESLGGVVTRHRIDTDVVETTDISCSHVVSAGDDLLVLDRFGDAKRYPSFEAILAGQEPERLDVNVSDSRVGSHDGRLYTAWHSTGEINRFDIETGEDLGPVTLEGHDGWVYGVDRGGDELLIATGDGVKKFDADTGSFIEVFPHLDWLQVGIGFSCRSGVVPE